MTTGNLSERIPQDGSKKDFDELAYNLNDMLDHIQKLMSDVRRVSDNIAHDLRTPLTRMRNTLEELSGKNEDPVLVAEGIEAIKLEADNLLNIFGAMLRITNIESGKRHSKFSNTDINELLTDLYELYEPLSVDKDQLFSINSVKQSVVCDADLLFQALANVVDNAVKYTPTGGEIDLSATVDKNQLKIEIADSGIGVPSAEFDNLFRRFYRMDQSRQLAGNGLGLSLVKAIIKLHKGSVTLSDNKPGLKVTI